MAWQHRILVFFNTDELGDQRFQLQARSDLLEKGIARLRRETSCVTLFAPNTTSCAVSAQVDDDHLTEFINYLKCHPDWTSYELDNRKLLRAAGREQ